LRFSFIYILPEDFKFKARGNFIFFGRDFLGVSYVISMTKILLGGVILAKNVCFWEGEVAPFKNLFSFRFFEISFINF